jgi:SNF2 family DNA or RNA helicase
MIRHFPPLLSGRSSFSKQGQLLTSLAERAADASCKTTFVMTLIKRLTGDGHRTLIFSQSRVMLDIIQVYKH